MKKIILDFLKSIWKNIMDRVKHLTINILDTFETLLDEYNIDIPDEFREGDESEARLYGDNYYRL